MLKRIPKIISPDLIKYLMEMGHSDTVVLADANFPAHSNANRILRLEGVEIPQLLEAILPYFPLDNFVPDPVRLMRNLPSEPTPEIWQTYRTIISRYDEEEAFKEFSFSERLPFYEESRKAYLIVQTATTARYANVLLQKGVV